MQLPGPSVAPSIRLPVRIPWAERATDGPRLTVLFDRECGVCLETVRALRRWDHGRRLEFLALQEAAASGRPLLQRLAAQQDLAEEIHVVDESTGAIAVGGQAALAILHALPGGWLLRPWSALPSTGVAADVLCRIAARHRDRVSWLVGLRDEVECPTRSAALGAGPGAERTVELVAEARSEQLDGHP